jgi:hypothetical protein
MCSMHYARVRRTGSTELRPRTGEAEAMAAGRGTSERKQGGSTRRWRKMRADFEILIANLGSVPCRRGGKPIRPGDEWDLGHQHDVALGGSDADGVWPEHRFRTPGCCEGNRNEGARVGNQLRGAVRAEAKAAGSSSGPPGGLGATGLSASLSPGRTLTARHAAGDAEPRLSRPEDFDGVPWLSDLLDVPENASWPRHMSPVHPEAVGSLGAEVEEWARIQQRVEFRWWQRLAFRRQLEFNSLEELLWRMILESGPRRIGKSVRLRNGALWRLDNADRFGERQLVMHTAKDLAICREVQLPAWNWAEEVAGWKVSRANGKEAVATPAMDRWLLRAVSAVYGYDVTLGLVDEAWDVEPGVVDEGIEPATMERVQPQVILTSTAHRKATSLMRRKIAAALSGMGEDFEVLLLLWGAGQHDDIGDPAVWRASSPHWSPDRERLIRSKYERAMRGEADPEADDPDPIEGFRAQYLNVWPRATVRLPGTEVVSSDDWTTRGSYEPGDGPRVIAVESWFGEGVTLAVGEALTGGKSGRAGVTVEEFATSAEAAARATQLMVELPVYAYLVGKSLTRDPAFEGAEPVQGRARQTVEDLDNLMKDDAIVHDGSELLAGQVTELRTKTGGGDSLQVVSKGRIDAVKAAVWAALRARELVNAEPEIY